jgi:hypothetical protein
MDFEDTFDIDLLIPDQMKGYWATKDGRQLKIRAMESSHIRNTINMLKRNLLACDNENHFYIEYYEKKIKEFEEELQIRDIYKKHMYEEID